MRDYCAWARWWWCVLALWALNTAAADVEIKLDSLTADGEVYSNVVIFSKSPTHISVSYAGGMASLKAKSLDKATQRKLGYLAPEESKTSLPPIAGVAGAVTDPRFLEIRERYQRNVEEFIQQLDKKTMYQILTLIGILYLFFCYCCWQICRKTSNRAGLLVWIPGFQMVPLLRAAGMSPWLFLTLIIPVVGAIVMIVWCFRICRVRQKSALLAIFLLLPVTNILAFLYLALSGYGPEEEEERGGGGKIKLGYQST
jgi:hypothetical protein